jgi:hypothetical protein
MRTTLIASTEGACLSAVHPEHWPRLANGYKLQVVVTSAAALSRQECQTSEEKKLVSLFLVFTYHL